MFVLLVVFFAQGGILTHGVWVIVTFYCQCLFQSCSTLLWVSESDISVISVNSEFKSPLCTALQIFIQPQSVALISGHNLRLSCHAVGKSPVQYQWFKTKEEVRHTHTHFTGKNSETQNSVEVPD